MNRELRPHQTRAIEMLRQSLGSGKRRPVLQAPTGFGKTLARRGRGRGRVSQAKAGDFHGPGPVTCRSNREGILGRWHPRRRRNPGNERDDGLVAPGTDRERADLAASSDPRSRRSNDRRVPSLVRFLRKWMTDPAWQSRPFIGLSATPWTRGLGQYFDDLIIAATTQDLISEGYLSPFRVFAPSHPDLTGVRTVAGDYHEGDLSGVMNDNPARRRRRGYLAATS